MGVGTNEGGDLHFSNNDIVTVKLDADALENIAQSGGGTYHLISTSNSDLNSLLTPIVDENINTEQNEISETSDWKSTGHYFVLLLIPFAALAFRKGWLLSISIIFCFSLVTPSSEILAATEDESNTSFSNIF